jgi:2-methylisocitrate lyase-like PEP mutase family enzyme
MLAHIAVIAAAADVPVNADFGSGYGADPAAVAANVRRCVETGVAGLSIEDSTGDDDGPLFPIAIAVERLRAARAAIDESDPTVVLTARAECYLVGVRDLGEVVTRLRAYAAAGADCLYAPGLATRDEMRAVAEAVAPKPVNVLAGASHPSADELAALGVRRVSLGSALARVAWSDLMRVAKRIASEGRFDDLSLAVPGAELNRFFTADAGRRREGETAR